MKYSESKSDKPFSHHNDIRKFKGQKYTNELKRKEIERKRYEKASTLRKYAKLCMKEGIQSDRVHIGKKDKSDNQVNNDNDIQKNDKQHEMKTKFDKVKHFQGKIEKHNELILNEQLEKERLISESLQNKKEALQKRAIKCKLLTKKTKKGQPVLGNQMKLILEKLQK